jgi:hypothetical protein
MKNKAKAFFAVTSWDEKTWDGLPAGPVEGEKLTHARVSYTYSGDLIGQSRFEYLMTYRADSSGVYVGLERLEVCLKGRSGSFIMEHSGVFDATSVRGEAIMVPGSASGDLQGLDIFARIEITGHLPQYPITFEYDMK